MRREDHRGAGIAALIGLRDSVPPAGFDLPANREMSNARSSG
jgi:hypothetical protein